MNRRLLNIILILLLLVSWVVIVELARDNKDLSNAVKIAEDFIDESQEEIEEMSNQVDELIREINRGIAENEGVGR